MWTLTFNSIGMNIKWDAERRGRSPRVNYGPLTTEGTYTPFQCLKWVYHVELRIQPRARLDAAGPRIYENWQVSRFIGTLIKNQREEDIREVIPVG